MDSDKLNSDQVDRALGPLPRASDPRFAGPRGWSHLRSLVAGFPHPHVTDEDRKNWHEAIVSFAKTFGCLTCSKDFELYVAQNPPSLESRATLIDWYCRAHNRVSAKLGKEQWPLDKCISQFVEEFGPIEVPNAESCDTFAADSVPMAMDKFGLHFHWSLTTLLGILSFAFGFFLGRVSRAKQYQ